MANETSVDARPDLKRDVLSVLKRMQSGRMRVHIPPPRDLGRRRQGSHFHGTPEFFVQTGGGTEFDCPGGRFLVRTHDVCIMPSEVPHAERPVNLRTKYGILVCMQARDGIFLQRARADADGQIQSYATIHLKSARGQNSFRYLDDAAVHDALPAAFHRAYIRSLVGAFLMVVLSELQRSLETEISTGSPLIVEAEKLVRTQLADPNLTVARVARSLRVSPDHLARKFRWERGLNPRTWIIRERIALALDLLSEGRRNVSEVGWACGFNEPSYFIRVFRRLVGTTPRTFVLKLNKNRSPNKRH